MQTFEPVSRVRGCPSPWRSLDPPCTGGRSSLKSRALGDPGKNQNGLLRKPMMMSRSRLRYASPPASTLADYMSALNQSAGGTRCTISNRVQTAHGLSYDSACTGATLSSKGHADFKLSDARPLQRHQPFLGDRYHPRQGDQHDVRQDVFRKVPLIQLRECQTSGRSSCDRQVRHIRTRLIFLTWTLFFQAV